MLLPDMEKTNSQIIDDEFAALYTEDSVPEKLTKEEADRIAALVAYKSSGPVYGAFGRWRKKLGKEAPKGDSQAITELKTFKLLNPSSGVARELTEIRRVGDTVWLR